MTEPIQLEELLADPLMGRRPRLFLQELTDGRLLGAESAVQIATLGGAVLAGGKLADMVHLEERCELFLIWLVSESKSKALRRERCRRQMVVGLSEITLCLFSPLRSIVILGMGCSLERAAGPPTEIR